MKTTKSNSSQKIKWLASRSIWFASTVKILQTISTKRWRSFIIKASPPCNIEPKIFTTRGLTSCSHSRSSFSKSEPSLNHPYSIKMHKYEWNYKPGITMLSSILNGVWMRVTFFKCTSSTEAASREYLVDRLTSDLSCIWSYVTIPNTCQTHGTGLACGPSFLFRAFRTLPIYH